MQLKLKRSAGVRVTNAVHRLIGKGNAARDRQDWDGAASAYGAALDADPSLGHIWMQRGHALKEAGDLDAAADAYSEARRLRPGDAEPPFHVGELHRRRGDLRAAVGDYLAAIRADDRDPRPLQALARAMGDDTPIDAGILAEAVRHDSSAPAAAAPTETPVAALDRVIATASGATDDDLATLRAARALLDGLGRDATEDAGPPVPIVFDLTDLVAHFRNHRLPTGIQRVQIEVVTRALASARVDTRLCCFVDGRETLLDVPKPLFVDLATLSTAGGDGAAPEWQVVKTRLFLHLFLAEPLAFRQGDTLVNLGTSWWIYNYYLLIRNAKRDHGIRYIPFVHDLIPIMATEHCVAGVVEDYVSWLVGVFDHADHFLANSESTARDLIRAAERLGRRLDPGMVDVVALNADFRRPSHRPLDAGALARWQLSPRGYCLIVSTIESRKNHLLALETWARLIDKHGADAVPQLVCVGRSGWLNTPFFERLREDWRLHGAVTVIERASDEELALLYEQCLFTLYPSHYEGWGLPVTESLCAGRVPVVADNSSLPEAAAGLGILFETNSPSACVAAVEQVLFDSDAREAAERRIAEQFRPRGWSAIARQIVDTVAEAARKAPRPATPSVAPGAYCPIALYKGVRIWRGLASGEMFRAGNGWLWPEPQGSRTTEAGGSIAFHAPATDGALRLYLRLRGLDRGQSGFTVSSGGQIVARGDLQPGEERWVVADLPASASGDATMLLVQGDAVEDVEMMTGGTLKRQMASISVVGFAVLDRDDEDGRVAFVESAALGALSRVGAYAEMSAHRSRRTALAS